MVNKKQLIDRVHEYVDCHKSMVKKVVENLLEEMEKELINGGKVHLVGFGSFECRRKPAREGRDPINHEKIHIPSSIHVGFKMGNKLKTQLRKKGKKA